MRARKQIQSAGAILLARLLGLRIPVAVRWNLLTRCPCRCDYCSLWRAKTEELSTDEVTRRLKEFARLGTTRISFSGGEPLLRKDIGQLVSAAAGLGISPTMNTSGIGLARVIDQLGELELLKISLDGPEAVHDRIRGRRGAFREAWEAADLGCRRLKKVSFATTITRRNVHQLDFVLEAARHFGTVVAFQPLKALYRGVEQLDSMAPRPEELRSAIQSLIRAKRAGEPGIRNSIIELEHMLAWPHFPPLRCGAGRIFVMVNPDGRLLPCDRIRYEVELPNLRTTKVREGLRRLPAVRCDGCAFCGALELNLLFASRRWPIRDLLTFVN